MTVRRPLLVAVLAGLIALAILAAVGVGTRGDSPEGAAQRPTNPTTSLSAAATPDSSGTHPGKAQAGAGDDATATSPGAAPSSDRGGSSSRAPKLEVPTDTGSADPGLPGLGHAARQQRASEEELRADFPTLQTRRAALVADHPRHTVPVPRGSDVQSSSLATEGGITQVGLVIHVRGSLDRAMRFYRIRLGRVGFTEGEAPAVATGAAAAFRRGPDRITVAAAQGDRGTEVTAFATLRTGG